MLKALKNKVARQGCKQVSLNVKMKYFKLTIQKAPDKIKEIVLECKRGKYKRDINNAALVNIPRAQQQAPVMVGFDNQKKDVAYEFKGVFEHESVFYQDSKNKYQSKSMDIEITAYAESGEKFSLGNISFDLSGMISESFVTQEMEAKPPKQPRADSVKLAFNISISSNVYKK